MKARIYRAHWVLEYLQNAGVSPAYGKNQFDTSKHDKHLSVWGWTLKLIENPLIQQYNSSYLASVFNDQCGSSMMPFFLYSTHETDRVYDRESAHDVKNT